MPNYKIVDSDKLDSDLTVVADAIRAKGGTADALAFPAGMKTAIENIKGGGYIDVTELPKPWKLYFANKGEIEDGEEFVKTFFSGIASVEFFYVDEFPVPMAISGNGKSVLYALKTDGVVYFSNDGITPIRFDDPSNLPLAVCHGLVDSVDDIDANVKGFYTQKGGEIKEDAVYRLTEEKETHITLWVAASLGGAELNMSFEDYIKANGMDCNITCTVVETLPDVMEAANMDTFTFPCYVLESTGIAYVSLDGTSATAMPFGEGMLDTPGADKGWIDSVDDIVIDTSVDNTSIYTVRPGITLVPKGLFVYSDGWYELEKTLETTEKPREPRVYMIIDGEAADFLEYAENSGGSIDVDDIYFVDELPLSKDGMYVLNATGFLYFVSGGQAILITDVFSSNVCYGWVDSVEEMDTTKSGAVYALRGSKTGVIYKVGENGTTNEVYIHENDEWQGFVSGVIDVDELPAKDIDKNTVYRVTKETADGAEVSYGVADPTREIYIHTEETREIVLVGLHELNDRTALTELLDTLKGGKHTVHVHYFNNRPETGIEWDESSSEINIYQSNNYSGDLYYYTSGKWMLFREYLSNLVGSVMYFAGTTSDANLLKGVNYIYVFVKEAGWTRMEESGSDDRPDTPVVPDIPKIVEKDVNFYDYDGTLLHSYTVEEAQALTELPPLPTQKGLICQEWNFDLDTIKSHNRALNIGATYITDDGKTRLYIKIASEGRMDVPLCFRQTVSNGVTIDWGDGSATQTFNGINNISAVHTYANIGEYVITLDVVDGCFLGLGHIVSSTNVMGIITTRAYGNMLKGVELGSGITSVGDYAFQNCFSLSKVVIPKEVTSIGNYAFSNCLSLTNLVIPQSVKQITLNAFYSCYSLASFVIPQSELAIRQGLLRNCYSLTSVAIHESVVAIYDDAFQSCVSLTNITVPKSVTHIGSKAFSTCYSMKFYDFTKHTAVPTLSNTNAFSQIPADCEIRVPAALYDEWKAATNWSTYADKIVGV